VEFDRRLKARGVRATAVHPGNIMTELMRHMTPEALRQMAAQAMADLGPGAELKIKTVPQGAATSVWAAVTAPAELVGGRYCEDCGVAETAEQGGGVRPYALDADHARRLWARSEELVSEQFPA
jgi:NAD(P)-dependent dehydrogenase (short-subunit alcohol dehydrogenase family)